MCLDWSMSGINAEKVKEYRLKLGLSQNALDKKAGVGGRTVRNIELGKGITVASLKKIADALGVPAAIFLD
jgi:transcriptional regulator with XRE-family HTH domain